MVNKGLAVAMSPKPVATNPVLIHTNNQSACNNKSTFSALHALCLYSSGQETEADNSCSYEA